MKSVAPLKLRPDATTLCLAAAALTAGWAAERLGVPAAWLIGPMLAALLCSLLLGWRVTVPPACHWLAQASVGMAASASFQPASLAVIADRWEMVAAAALTILALSLLSGLLLARLAGIDRPTAVLGMLSGGAPSMVAISDELDADARLVAFMQYARLLLVIVTASLVAAWGGSAAGAAPPATPAPAGAAAGAGTGVSWSNAAAAGGLEAPVGAYLLTAAGAAVGAWAASRLGIPAAGLVGPALAGLGLGAMGLPHGVWPRGWLPLAYLILGVAVGCRFDPPSLRATARRASVILIAVVLLLAACGILGWVLAQLTGMDWLTAYLATAPGGVESVTVAALDAGADAATVLAVQLARMLAVVVLGPMVIRRLVRGAAGRPGAREAGGTL